MALQDPGEGPASGALLCSGAWLELCAGLAGTAMGADGAALTSALSALEPGLVGGAAVLLRDVDTALAQGDLLAAALPLSYSSRVAVTGAACKAQAIHVTA